MSDKSKIQVQPINGERTREQLISLVDDELNLFNAWFTATFPGNQDLSRFERAILKTYLMKKLEDNSTAVR